MEECKTNGSLASAFVPRESTSIDEEKKAKPITDKYDGSYSNLSVIQQKSGSIDDSISKNDSPKGCFGARHVFALMAFFGLACIYMLRVNLSVAIIDMLNQTDTSNLPSNDSNQLCPVPITPNKTDTQEGEFSWDDNTKGLILGCFFWGYIVMQLPGGLLAERYGAKYVFGVGVFLTGVFSLLIPVAARASPEALIVVRVLTGAAEGVTLPALHALLPKWVPFSERSTLGAFVLAGMQLGTVISLPLSGYLCELEWDNGWPLAFYVPGIATVIWFVFWVLFVYEEPDVHPRIAEDEKQYILASTSKSQHKNLPIPWLSILTSIRFWPILVAHVGQNWGFYVLLTELPNYMKNVLHFDLKSNSLLSALPYLAMFILSNVFSVIADTLRKKKVLNLTQARKIFQSIGTLIPACALIGAVYTGCDRVSTVALITIAVGFNGAVYSGFNVNHMDISPNFSGVLMGITNGVSNICGFLAPYIVESLPDEGSTSKWDLVFFIAAGVYAASDLFFVMFATGEVQPWNESEVEDKTDAENSPE